MENQLRAYRKRAGLTLEAVSKRLGLSISQVSRLERGVSDLTGERLQQFADLYGARPADFIDGGRDGVPLIGQVGAGAEIHWFDAARGHEFIAAPPGATDRVVAVEVHTDSMVPAYRAGDVIYYAREPDVPPEASAGAECVVKLANGPCLLKTMLPGAKAGHWNLISYNSAPIEDAAVEWSAPVLWIDKRRRLR